MTVKLSTWLAWELPGGLVKCLSGWSAAGATSGLSLPLWHHSALLLGCHELSSLLCHALPSWHFCFEASWPWTQTSKAISKTFPLLNNACPSDEKLTNICPTTGNYLSWLWVHFPITFTLTCWVQVFSNTNL